MPWAWRQQPEGNGASSFRWYHSQGQGSTGYREVGLQKSTNIQGEQEVHDGGRGVVADGELEFACSDGGIPMFRAVPGPEICRMLDTKKIIFQTINC